MAVRDDDQMKDPDDGAASSNPARRLKLTIAALIVVMAGALFLKAVDDRQREDRSALLVLQGEALAVAERINGRADAAETAINVVATTRASRGSVAKASPGIDAVVSLNDARQAPDGSRLGHAAETADALRATGRRLGLSQSGDIVLVTTPDEMAPMIAIAPAGTWLPNVGDERAISLIGTGRFVRGNGELAAYTETLSPTAAGILSAPDQPRAAAVCVAVSGGEVSVCSVQARPLVSLDDLIRMLIYALLLAAPVLAIVGLMNRLTEAETATIKTDTRDEEADRILAVVMKGARAGYWEWKPDSQGIYLSDGAANLFGAMTHGMFSEAEFLNFVHVDHRQRIQETLLTARSIGWIQTSFLVNSHTPRWIELRGAATSDTGTDASDPADAYGGIALDITQRKQAEDRVKAAERRLRNAIEGFNGPFALWDHRKRLLYWNRAFALDFGLQDTLRPGMSHDTVAVTRAPAILKERQSTEDSRTTLIALTAGRWLKMVERSTPDGGLITVGIDVTENVRNEEELKKQRQNMKKAVMQLERSKGRAGELARKYGEEKAKAEHAAHTKSAFLANMSHELRTPLNAINGFSEIIANELYGPLGDQRYKGYAGDILTSGQHLLDMINDILDMAKIEAGKMTISPQPIDPVDPVDAAIRMIRRRAEDKGIELELQDDPNLPDIDADHRAIRQMVLNLISNAIKFTDAGGKITVDVQQRGPEIYVGVTDTGIGIPEEDLPRLATPFEQVSGSRDRNYEGTGLGLALTKSFAEMHGGRMMISSIEGEGTTVGFTLPIGGPGALDASGEIGREIA